MTTEQEISPQRRFVPAFLPWLLAAGIVVVYLATLNHWISFANLPQVAKASGWLWQPDVYQPLVWLVTYPFHWLPVKTIPLALNLFTAICAALTVALLARSVALLPHDRTEEQRSREKCAFSLLSIPSAWLPPVLAVLVCGLQLTFWEHATTASGEILDLLLFAYIIRCVFEFRIDERESWLLRASLVCGLAMTNNWAMIAFFPLFLVALVWLQGLAFFNVRFLVRASLCGLAGLSLYLLLPTIQSMADISPVPFWTALKANLSAQKSVLLALPFNKEAIFNDARPLWVLALPSLMPLLVMGIRWPAYFGDPSRLGVTLATLTFHFFHALLLVVCVWVALDPPLSPRNLLPELPLLPFYYLGALSIGYFSGYFLLVFRPKPTGSRFRPSPSYLRPLNLAATSVISLLLIGTPALLLYRNLPQIRVANGPLLAQFAALQIEGLPAHGAVVLSDDPRRLFLAESVLTRAGKSKNYLFVDTGSLRWPDYHRFLKKRYSQRWPIDPPKKTEQVFTDMASLQVLMHLAQTNDIFYLHPSFGFFFELFYQKPHGLAYQLSPCPTNSLVAPLPTKELIAENEAFWTKADTAVLNPLLATLTPPAKPNPGVLDAFTGFLIRRAHLPRQTSRTAPVLAAFYSQALDFWGVQLQQAGQLPQAAVRFNRALDLNPDNRAAQANKECNSNLQAGRNLTIRFSKDIVDEFGKYRSWNELLGDSGPFDDPSFCFQLALLYSTNNLFRQAAQQFDRVKTLVPDNLPARLWLAQLYILARMPDAAVKIVDEIHSQSGATDPGRDIHKQLLQVETSARLAAGDLKGADTAVQKVMQKYPNDEEFLVTATQVYLQNGAFSNALVILDQQLKIAPDNRNALVNKGFACLQLGACEQAIAPLTRVVMLETNAASELLSSALLNRAIAYLRTDKLEAAQHDYEALQKNFPTAFQIYYGLGEIAYRNQDTNAAIRNYQLYLTNSPPDTQEAKYVIGRLKELKQGSP